MHLRRLSFLALLGITAVLAGCAHPIMVTPDATTITRTADSPPKVRANVAYYISPEFRAREVTTEGGGGDRIRYYPYRDIEAGLEKMLSNIFENVSRTDKPDDAVALSKDGIRYVVAPDIVTTSGSPSLFTWPPTTFTVDLTSNVREASGKLVGSPRVVGNGQAEFSDFKSNHGLAGQLAMADALRKMQRSLNDLLSAQGELKAATTAAPRTTTGTAERLAELKRMRDGNLITEADYESKKKKLLDEL